MKLKRKPPRIEDILKESGAAGLIRYGQEQLEINRKTILNWMSSIGKIQTIHISDGTDEVDQQEDIECEVIDLYNDKFDKLFEFAPFFIKDVEIKARQAIRPEIVVQTAPDEPDIIANADDWIVTNPHEEFPYVIKYSDFTEYYMPKPGEPGTYISVGKPVKSIKNDRNVVFLAPWGQLEAIRGGDYIIENSEGERYGIVRKVFEQSYKQVNSLPMRFRNHEGDFVEIDCFITDLNTSEFDVKFDTAPFYKKHVEIRARRATTLEQIDTHLDATKNTANPGDWIVANPGEEPYVIKSDTFSKLYQPKEGDEGVYISIGKPVKGIEAIRDIVFVAPWGELQAVRGGGFILQNMENERYGIDRESFSKTYRPVSHMMMKIEEKDGSIITINCELVDINNTEFDEMFAHAKMYKKNVIISARQARKTEIIRSGLEATQNTANPGDWIVYNPGEKPYVIRENKFLKLYRPLEGQDGKYISIGKPVKRIVIDRNIVFIAPWRELQAVPAGRSILENADGERYRISDQSFNKFYVPYDPQEDV